MPRLQLIWLHLHLQTGSKVQANHGLGVRVQEGLQNVSQSVRHYREVLAQDSSNIEAIACIGMHHFYTDQPEVSLRFYRYSNQATFN